MLQIKRHKIFLCGLLSLFFLGALGAFAKGLTPDQISKGVVSISTRATVATLNLPGEFSGTGFIVDKARGIIATNEHVVDSTSVTTLKVTFHNGRKLDARVLYVDPLVDFAFVQVPPESLKDMDIAALLLAKDEPQIGTQVTIVGSNEGYQFSVHEGQITNLYDTTGFFSHRYYGLSSNTRGGSSGSPLVDARGQVIAIKSAGSDGGHNFAIPSLYLRDALMRVQEGRRPLRRWTGLSARPVSLDDAHRFYHFPEKEIDGYAARHVEAKSQALVVLKCLGGTPSSSAFQLGDVIWRVNGQEIGADHYLLDKIVNQTEGPLTFQVWRGEKLIELTVAALDLYALQSNKIVTFGGAVFFKADHHAASFFGYDLGTILMANVSPNSIFSSVNISPEPQNYYVYPVVKLAGGAPISSLEQLQAVLSSLKEIPYFSMEYKMPFWYGFDQRLFLNSRDPQMANIENYLAPADPVVYVRNEAFGWDVEKSTCSK